jgi:hypothetical protein
MNVASDNPIVASGKLAGRNSPKLPAAAVAALDAMKKPCEKNQAMEGRSEVRLAAIAKLAKDLNDPAIKNDRKKFAQRSWTSASMPR